MPQNQGKVDRNTADHDELTRIVGIDDDCADRIIECREQHGCLQSIQELTDELKGFGDQAMRHVCEHATT